eukprot:gene8878-12012_t
MGRHNPDLAALGQQPVVIKSLEANYRRVRGVSGATILGDGRVSLIIDVGAIVRLSSQSSQHPESHPMNTAAGDYAAINAQADGNGQPYAVAVIHDINENQKMDFSALGFPKEDWGMSNNVRPSLRAPTFKESAIKVGNSPVTISVTLAR